MAKPSKFVVYSNLEEVLITTKDREDTFIDEYFTRGMRDLEDFDRKEARGSCAVARKALTAIKNLNNKETTT